MASLQEESYPPFEYAPLEDAKDCIRLLQILPGSQDAPVHCSMRHVRIENEKYECLSYCWGTEEASECIYINGKSFMVRPNLHRFLINARRYRKHGWYWIDAISIDQLDNDEKSIQVRMMSTIYERAVATIVWLGLSDLHIMHLMRSQTLLDDECLKCHCAVFCSSVKNPENPHQERELPYVDIQSFHDSREFCATVASFSCEDSVMQDAIVRLGKAKSRLQQTCTEAQNLRLRLRDHRVQVLMNLCSGVSALQYVSTYSDSSQSEQATSATDVLLSEQDVDLWKQYLDVETLRAALFGNPYWTRAWIVQEVCLPSHKYILSPYSGLSLQTALELMLFYSNDTGIQETGNTHLRPNNSLRTLQQNLCGRGPYNKAMSFFEALMLTDHRECYDYRDRIYSTLAFMKDGHDFPVDYTISGLELYSRCILYTFKNHINIRYLYRSPEAFIIFNSSAVYLTVLSAYRAARMVPPTHNEIPLESVEDDSYGSIGARSFWVRTYGRDEYPFCLYTQMNIGKECWLFGFPIGPNEEPYTELAVWHYDGHRSRRCCFGQTLSQGLFGPCHHRCMCTRGILNPEWDEFILRRGEELYQSKIDSSAKYKSSESSSPFEEPWPYICSTRGVYVPWAGPSEPPPSST